MPFIIFHLCSNQTTKTKRPEDFMCQQRENKQFTDICSVKKKMFSWGL